MNRLLLALMFGLSPLVAMAGWAQSVSVDATSLIQRLDAIETRLNAAEARRGGAASSGLATTGSAYTAGDLDRRMEEIETESSQLRGSNDRAMQAIEKLAKRMDDFSKDVDMRLSDIEAKLETVSAAPAGAPVAATPAVSTPAAAVSPAATPVAAATPTAPAVKPAAAIPADMSAADHYNKAYAYLTATDYKNAQAWFEEFLKRHPKDALADNAYYWLGEVYLVQNNPKAAAGKFLEGIKSFPKGNKVTANLFKMGVALEQMKEYPRAKMAWEKLIKDYPTAPEAARAKDKLLQLKTTGA